MNDFYFYKADLNEKQPNVLVCYCSGSRFNLEAFYNQVVTQFKQSIFTRNLVLISPAFNKDTITEKLFNKVAINKLKDRINSFQELNVHSCFVGRNGELDIGIMKDANDNNAIKLKDKELGALIEYGIVNIVKERDLVIESSPNFHFIKPSGKHTSKFISVANILESASEVSFIACCLLKFVPDKINRIYVDTSGIYTLAHEVANILNAFSGSSKIISVDSFGSYGGVESYLFDSDKETLVLISASTSSDLYNKLNSYSALEQASIVSVVMTAVNSTNQKVLVEFEKYKNSHCETYFKHFDSYEESDCPMCLKEHSIPVALHKSRFIFDAPRTEQYLPLAIDSDQNLRRLISDYKDHKALNCLFDGLKGQASPPPEYYIDVSELIERNDKFRSRAKNLIMRHFPLNTDCIIYCKDKGAKELAEYIHSQVMELGLDTEICEGGFDESNVPKKGVVVVAGSIQSGKSLLNISRDLRDQRHLPVTYIVGFAKYNSENEYNKLQKDLTFADGPCGHHEFHAIEKILLPIKEHKFDSWQKELEVLNELEQKYIDEKELKEIVKNRELFLRKASSEEEQGIGEEIFLPSPNDKKMILGATFAFWNKADNADPFSHQATVYFTISSVLQKLRTCPRNNGIIPLGSGYIIRQLDPLLFDRFNEGVIHASVLRAAKSRELNYSADDDKSKIVGSLIERMLKYPELKESEGLNEFLLALATKKLQIKNDHLIGLKKHQLDKDKYPLTWILAEHAKTNIFDRKEPKIKF